MQHQNHHSVPSHHRHREGPNLDPDPFAVRFHFLIVIVSIFVLISVKQAHLFMFLNHFTQKIEANTLCNRSN